MATNKRKSGMTRVGLAVGFAALCLAALLMGLRMEVPARAAGTGIGLVIDGASLDQGFNLLSYQGLQRAETELGVVGTVYTTPTSADYAPQLQQCVDDGNDLCISVGMFMSEATSSTAKTNPGAYFAIVDYSWDAYLHNLRGMTFAEDEAGYLAGTLAGLMTQADVVGAVGGMPIPVVVRFVEGYRNGAQCVNADVTVLISYTTSFVDPDQGAQVAQAMIGHRADVIFGAGGPTGSGGVLTATQSGVWGIGVDVDEYTTLFMSGTVAGSDKLLSSAIKRVDNAVFSTISDVVHSAFTSGTVKYDLVQQGVGLAPFHETEPSVPQSVRDTLAQAEQGIVQGMIDVNNTCRNRVYLPAVLKNP